MSSISTQQNVPNDLSRPLNPQNLPNYYPSGVVEGDFVDSQGNWYDQFTLEKIANENPTGSSTVLTVPANSDINPFKIIDDLTVKISDTVAAFNDEVNKSGPFDNITWILVGGLIVAVIVYKKL